MEISIIRPRCHADVAQKIKLQESHPTPKSFPNHRGPPTDYRFVAAARQRRGSLSLPLHVGHVSLRCQATKWPVPIVGHRHEHATL